MQILGRKRKDSWTATVFAAPREVFATAEQVTALPPYAFRVVDDRTAEVVQDRMNGFFGQWRQVPHPKNRVRIECRPTDAGTEVRMTAVGDRSALLRASNLIRLLTVGERDRATVYRYRAIPQGGCTLVQSWAGTGYPLYREPDLLAERGRAVRPASPLLALEQRGRWVRVLAGAGEQSEEGWIEADQLVPDLNGDRG
ncbi:MAG: hypothetical protein M0T72_04340 [Candidatus Dormibacteraeota bacterium]|nr:hypothetical protein [Candidatus Dormibacteraeota bacterium]